MQNALTLIRHKVGRGSVQKFVEKELGVSYRTFVYQCRHSTVPYKTIVKLIDKLGVKFEDFKDYTYIDHAQEAKDKHQEKKKQKKEEEVKLPQPQKLSSIFGKI